MTFDEWLDEQTIDLPFADKNRALMNYPMLVRLVRAQRQLLALPEDYGGLPHEREKWKRLRAEVVALEEALIGK